jgi:hypothetical protein
MLRSRPFALALVTVIGWCGITAAADLSLIDRTIRKEPAYQSNTPKYCLLVFGQEVKDRVWLVLDGDTLYVDRNGNGDLTEPDEKVSANKQDNTEEELGRRRFEVGDLRVGGWTHKGLQLTRLPLKELAEKFAAIPGLKEMTARDPKATGYILSLDVDIPGRKGNGIGGRVSQSAGFADVSGVLQFAEKPADTPVVHFGGPWQITLDGPQYLRLGRSVEVNLALATPGHGPGSSAWVCYEELVPEDAYPKAVITFPPKGPGGRPVTELYDLKERC